MYNYLVSEDMDFRDFNISRILAKKLLEDKHNYLEEIEKTQQNFNRNYINNSIEIDENMAYIAD